MIPLSSLGFPTAKRKGEKDGHRRAMTDDSFREVKWLTNRCPSKVAVRPHRGPAMRGDDRSSADRSAGDIRRGVPREVQGQSDQAGNMNLRPFIWLSQTRSPRAGLS